MLALAKVEQLRQQGDAPVVDWAEVTRAVALDLAPLIAKQQLDFDIDTESAPVRAHEWALARADAQPAAQRHQAQSAAGPPRRAPGRHGATGPR